jgi:hypothetical protein
MKETTEVDFNLFYGEANSGVIGMWKISSLLRPGPLLRLALKSVRQNNNKIVRLLCL